ncbi:putative DNA ligase [Nostocoides japonicum T1-X7]|uniref:Probable DNA ligase n=1 Tax=Nostocoides japonicum T1-X7 TaxID=1194083 RepID=A0A077M344_9MICO|nr:ATP-dependent DNA ligase [Tetrasphaera japonica]CCH78595.1 putative DNA ligase [Tetrasphaera japonica T1-X7]
MLYSTIVTASHAAGATRSRTAKVATVAAVISAAAEDEVGIVVSHLSGVLPQRRLGVGWRTLGSLPEPASTSSLSVVDVDDRLSELAAATGAGSVGRRRAALNALMARATTDEQDFLRALITGNLRQGALDGVMLQAVAVAYDLPESAVRRAVMLSGTVAPVAQAARAGGLPAVEAVELVVGRPVRPMLASSATTVTDALGDTGREVLVDGKLDGIRLQAHRRDGEVSLFTRSLDDITDRLPEVVEAVTDLPGGDLVVDGEAIVLRSDGRPEPFQVTGARTASSADVAALRASAPVTTYLFDVLHADGRTLLDEPAVTRHEVLSSIAPHLLVPRIVTADPQEAQAFFADLVSGGHEGVVVKSVSGRYAAGRRGKEWVKVKPVHTLDLVVLAVERGSGRRRGTLSNIHLGARDPEHGGFVMLGKTFKGMTDAMLAWQTERFAQLATDDDGWVVTVRPEQVVEIAVDGLQRSSRYPGGVALRFARVVRYRDDKTAEEADTIETVRRLGS